jgi:transposase-like protein
MRRHYTAEQRGQLLELVASGRSVRETAARLGIVTSTASYWVRQATAKARQVRPRAARRGGEPPAFARLVREHEAASIEVRVGGATIQVAPGFDAELLRAVVVALRGEVP